MDKIKLAKDFVISYLEYMGFDEDFIKENFNVDIIAEICYTYYEEQKKWEVFDNDTNT